LGQSCGRSLGGCPGAGYRERVLDDAVIAEAGRRLSEAAPPGSRVILFGSAARGELTRDSDLDFLVIEPEVENAALESVRLRRVLGDLVLAADVIVASEYRVKEWRDVGGEPDPRGAGRGQGAGGLMASKQDLAEQLLRRADDWVRSVFGSPSPTPPTRPRSTTSIPTLARRSSRRQ